MVWSRHGSPGPGGAGAGGLAAGGARASLRGRAGLRVAALSPVGALPVGDGGGGPRARLLRGRRGAREAARAPGGRVGTGFVASRHAPATYLPVVLRTVAEHVADPRHAGAPGGATPG